MVREDGTPTDPGEPGELVHRGPLVSLGYWNDPQRTAERFRPAPGQPAGLPLQEIAVWSGDLVRRDEEGFLYFVGRRDDMIKTSGYRVSPTEIEEVVFASGLVDEVAAIGLPHETLGQSITLLVKPANGAKRRQGGDPGGLPPTAAGLYAAPSYRGAGGALPQSQRQDRPQASCPGARTELAGGSE